MKSRLRWVFVACAAGSLAGIAVALHLWGAAEIRANPGEVVFLTGVGAAGLFLASKLFAWLGVSFRDDVVERRNIAALLSLCGALVAVSIIYAVQDRRADPRSDLAHSLRRWQDGGLTLQRLGLDDPSRLEAFEVARPSWYGAMFQRALASIGLRRAAGGGFGEQVPDTSAGG